MTDGLPWPFAGRVAGLVAGDHPLARSYHIVQLADTLPRTVVDANRMVAEETGLVLPGDPDVVVVDRRTWVERNIGSFEQILAPAQRRLEERLEKVGADGETAPAIARRLIALEAGTVLGVLARRVLGQYELVLPGGAQGDSVAFVGANILQMERNSQLVPSEFRMWIALHEAAHRAQFVGVPWLRGYFMELVSSMVDSIEPDEVGLATVVERFRAARKAGEPLIDERGLFGLFATHGQQAMLDRVQALMSLLEGHGHVVMDRLGERVLVSQARMSALLKQRRRDPKTAVFFRLTGMEMKIRQYEQGERFVLAVERQAGWSAVDNAWAGPEALPTLAEIKEPSRWLARVA